MNKSFIYSIILAYSVYCNSDFFNPREISPTDRCIGIPDGTKLHNKTDCSRFIVCDQGVGFNLPCRSTEPFFNRCSQLCENDYSVCFITNCHEVCNPACNPNGGTFCDCPEQWGCFGGQCRCNTAIQCPFDDIQNECTLFCGCPANCNCESPGRRCVCHLPCRCNEPPAVCPFLPSNCVSRCSCSRRCLCNGEFCTCHPDMSC